MEILIDNGQSNLKNVSVVVLEPDALRASNLLSILRALNIRKVVVAPSLQAINTNHNVDVILAEIRPTSNDGLMLASLFKVELGSQRMSYLPRILWIAEKNHPAANAELSLAALNFNRDGYGARAQINGVCYKALDAHAQLTRDAGFTVTTLYTLEVSKVEDALTALLATPTVPHLPLIKKEGVPNEHDVISALVTGEGLSVVFQPQYNLRSGNLIGAEALVRWRHSHLGNISPTTLIPMVNKLGLHLLLFSFVQAKVLKVLRTLQAHQIEMPISVNASIDTVCTAGFSDHLADRMSRAQLPNHLLKVELTEELPVVDELCLSAALNALRTRGFCVSLDDFGSGSCTLRQLSRMPFDELKIDATLIRDITQNPSARRIVAATLALGHRLNVVVVAEGIETHSAKVLLRRLGCVHGQGFALSPPMELPDFLRHVDDKRLASSSRKPYREYRNTYTPERPPSLGHTQDA